MRKEMKKNNKMLLALVVVAALAMVSVAGIVLSEKSDAAGYRNDQMKGGTTNLLETESNMNAEFYIALGTNETGMGYDFGVQYVSIADGVTISGTISVGTADANGKNFVEFASVTLSEVQNAVFTLLLIPDENGNLVGMIMVGDMATIDTTVPAPYQVSDYKAMTGTVEVKSGGMVAGAIRADFKGVFNAYIESLAPASFYNIGGNIDLLYAPVMGTYGAIAPFTGTIIAGESKITAASIMGMAVGVVDGRSVVYNEVVQNAKMGPWKEVEMPVDNLSTTTVDESLIYINAGTPTLPARDNPSTTTVDESTTMICIPVNDFSVANVTFASGDWSVGFPEGFSDAATSNVGNFFRLVNINGVVAEGAKVIVGDNMPTVATKVVVSVPALDIDGTTALADVGDILFLVPEKGPAIKGIAAASTTAAADGSFPIEFTFDNVALNTDYTILGSLAGGTIPYYSIFSVVGSGASYLFNIAGNMAVDASNDVSGLAAATNGVDMTFNYTTMGQVVGAWNTITGNLAFNNNVPGAAGTISGAIDAAASTGDFIFVIFSYGGLLTFYMGAADVAVPAPNEVVVAYDVNNQPIVSPTAQVTGLSVLPANSVTKFQLRTTYDNFAGGMFAPNGYTFTVIGEMDILFTSATAPEIYGKFETSYNAIGGLGNSPLLANLVLTGTNGTVYNLYFEDKGLIAYSVNPALPASTIGHPMAGVGNLNAAFWIDDKKPTALTYNYTTLKNALDESNKVTIVGWIYLLEDEILLGHINYEPADTTEITISNNSGLQIGRKAFDVNGTTMIGYKGATYNGTVIADQSYNPIIDLPSGTNVIKSGNAKYIVQFGQAVYDDQPVVDPNIPLAEVLIVTADKYIYTDLWTALDITDTDSNDTINLLVFPRQIYADSTDMVGTPYSGAVLDQNGTLKRGVTLVDATQANLMINEGVVFTTLGKVTSTKQMTINGTLLINGKDSTFAGGASATIGPNGGINVAEGGVLTIEGNSAITGAAGSVVNVDGTLDVKAGTLTADIIQIAGTTNASSVNALTANVAFIIGKIPSLASEAYTNEAVLNGNGYVVNNVALVFGELKVPTSFGTNKTDYVIAGMPIGDVKYASVYGAATVAIPMLNVEPLDPIDALIDITISDWNNKKDLEGDNVSTNSAIALIGSATASPKGPAGWKTVYANWDWNTFTVTFAPNNGVKWTAYSVPAEWSNTMLGWAGSANVDGSGTGVLRYGMEIVVNATANAGFTGDISIMLNDKAFAQGSTWKVVENAVFKSNTNLAPGSDNGGGDNNGGDNGGSSGNSWSDPIVILLIVIIIIIAIIAIVVAAKLLRS